MSFSFGPRIVRDGLVFHIDAAIPSSYPGSGNTWYDLSGNNYNLTISGSVGVGSNYIQFNSASYDYAYLSSSALQNYTDITAVVWKYSLTHTTQYETYFNYNMDGTVGDKGWAIRNINQIVNSSNYFAAWGGNGTSTGNNVKFYINSRLAASSSTTMTVNNIVGDITGSWQMLVLTATGVTSWNTNYYLAIGRRSDRIPQAVGINPLDARISCAMLYNRVLSSTEIQQNYNALKGRFGL